ncbi:polymorphic toxin-type HINT domain-containing protein [Catellatospora sp. NPDC049133]|uniref:polymorphic toxin-type HINT domain-containing protein n=1 Tax=Catellatospora sp. NPDC049133 TaxID=3155499 RepID=UPI0033FFF7B7
MTARVGRGRRKRLLVAALALPLVAGLLQVPAPPAAAERPDGPRMQAQPAPAKGTALKAEKAKPDPTADKTMTRADKVTWPSAGSAELAADGKPATLGGMPVTVAAAASAADGRGRAAQPADRVQRVTAQVVERRVSERAGVSGPMFGLSRADGAATGATVRVQVGYQGFAHARGGDFGARLRLVALPACAATTPERAECRIQRPVPSVNDVGTQTLRADVQASATGAGAMMFALTAGDSSAQGDYKATQLAPSSSWQTALSSGGFAWNYPIRVPATPSGLGPQVALSYSSQGVDGSTAATNNQGSWVGQGFSYEPGYIERRYKPCKDDGHDTSADQCWAFHNGTIMLNGASGTLVKIDDNTWKSSSDDGAKIERLEGAVNGDDNGEYWKVTTTDGTQYFFGKNRLNGWSANKEETKSVWSAPVYGDDSGEPCHQSSGFADSYCNQAWRWNLDYVIDPRGSVISYFYGRETNHFARGGRTDVDGAAYHRGGYLARIDYGQRDNEVYSTNAPARVVFSTFERCIPGGGVDCDEQDLTETTAASWPDVPEDLICAAGTHCEATQAAPTFFTRKRLTKIQTQVRGATDWLPVESWALEHDFKANDDASRTLWLKKITHTGHWGGTDVTLPPTELDGIQLPNRIVKDGDNLGPLIRYRLSTVKTDTGAQITINYKAPDCTKDNLPTAGNSTLRCYPVVWNPLGGDDEDRVTDWFHKYVVDSVVEDDLVGGNDDMVAKYEYVGTPAWRKTDPDGITKEEYLTWSQWRGYQQVTVRNGNGQSMPGRIDHFFLRGMSGAELSDGTKPVVTRTDSTGAGYTDHDEWSGHALETIVYNGSQIVSKTIKQPWRQITRTQTETWGSNVAAYVGTDVVRELTAMPDNPPGTPVWRETKKVTTYDPTWGRVTKLDDLGEVGTGKDGDDRCTLTYYADSPTKYMYSYVSRTRTVAAKCDVTSPNLNTQLLADARTSYDLGAWGAAPTKGIATRSETLDRYDGTNTLYIVDSEITSLDTHGRALSAKDARAIAEARPYAVQTEYIETFGLTTQVKITNALGYSTTNTVDPAYGAPTASVDLNGKRTDLVYDGLGRIKAVWLPDRSKADGAGANTKFTYLVRNDKSTVISTEMINNDGGYRISHELFDGLLRPRQNQAPGSGGWLLTDTFHDGLGRAFKVNAAYLATGTAGDIPIITPEGSVNGQTTTTFDQAGRPIVETFSVAGDARWSTTTSYEGDRVHTDPPTGGTPTTVVTDARGQTTELHQYHGASPTGPADVTRFTYTAAGLLDKSTDAAGNVWDHDYNQRGQEILTKDPDSGNTERTYNTSGDVTSSKDARQLTLSHKYDVLGRKIETWQGAVGSGTKLSAWVYDTLAGAKGQLHYSQRFAGGHTYSIVTATRDSLYRPTKVRYAFPSAGVGTELGAAYEFTAAYNTDGTAQSFGMPAAGGLAAEAVATTYDSLLRPTALTGSSSYVVAEGTRYGNLDELLGIQLYTGAGKKAWLSYEYERGTGRLTRARLDRQDISFIDMDARYQYDDSGNVLSIADAPVNRPSDIQCFDYDYLGRLTKAWAHASAVKTCADGVAQTGVGGPAPYHHSWTYDKAGNRDVETIHSTVPGVADTVRDYTNPAQGQGQNQPHTVTRIDEVGPNGNKTYNYGYDQAGNTACRPNSAAGNVCTTTPSGHQDLTWDAEGHLATSTPAGGQPTSFIYDADGNRIVRKEPNGSTTLYLPGMELTRTGTVVAGTRYYSFEGQIVAVRTSGGVFFQAADHHGTAGSTINAATGDITLRRTTPFGTARGTAPTFWPDQKGFIGGTQDPTSGLTHIGAREYDPGIGRFVNPDPLQDLGNPQQWNAYTYSSSSPVTKSDPSGMVECHPEEGDCGADPVIDGPQWTTTYPNGTELTLVIEDGDPFYCIDGFCFNEKDVPDPYVLAESVDKQVVKWRKSRNAEELTELDVIVLLSNGCLNAATWVCSSFLENDLHSYHAALVAAESNPSLGQMMFTALLAEVFSGFTGAGCGGWRSPRTAPRTVTGRNSFAPGTLVLMADGTTKPIEDVRVGDQVVATDPETGVTAVREVTALHENADELLTDVSIRVDGVDGVSTVHTTWEHPFWVASARYWAEAADLRFGDDLRTADGVTATVLDVRNRVGQELMYNLTVADIHTYYVLAGETPVLVHNTGGPKGGPTCNKTMNGWPKQEGGNCYKCALKIQKKLGGGEIVYIKPKQGSFLGTSTHNPDGDWTHHYVVVKDGRVYDGTTGKNGLTPDQFKAQWNGKFDYRDNIDFGF